MSFEHEKREAMRILKGIENATSTPLQSWTLIEDADPTLVYFIITWLRDRYSHDRAAEGVLGRVIELVNYRAEVGKIMKEGQEDSIVDWFEDAYQYRDFNAEDFIDLIVEKLEG